MDTIKKLELMKAIRENLCSRGYMVLDMEFDEKDSLVCVVRNLYGHVKKIIYTKEDLLGTESE